MIPRAQKLPRFNTIRPAIKKQRQTGDGNTPQPIVGLAPFALSLPLAL